MKRNVWTKESEYYVQRFIAFPFQLPEFFASLSLSTHNNILYIYSQEAVSFFYIRGLIG